MNQPHQSKTNTVYNFASAAKMATPAAVYKGILRCQEKAGKANQMSDFNHFHRN